MTTRPIRTAIAGVILVAGSLAGAVAPLTLPASAAGTVATSVALTTTTPTPPAGAPAHVRAVVTGSDGGVPTGVVQFTVGNHHVLATVPVDGQGVAETDLALPTPRTRSVRAYYRGDAIHAKAKSSKVLISPQAPFDPRLRTYVVAKPRAGGYTAVWIQVRIGYKHILRPSGTVSADNGFVCRPFYPFSTRCHARLTPGAHPIVSIVYSGDANYAPASTQVPL